MGAIKIKGETSGSTTIVAPATGSDVTMTLPGSSLDLGAELASKLPIAGGKILQIVRATDTIDRTTNSGPFVDGNLSVSITPLLATSKIMVIYTGRVDVPTTSTNWAVGGGFQITDSSNVPISGAEGALYTWVLQAGGNKGLNASPVLIGYTDANNTSARSYKMRFQKGGDGGDPTIKNSLITGQIYAIEVSA